MQCGPFRAFPAPAREAPLFFRYFKEARDVRLAHHRNEHRLADAVLLVVEGVDGASSEQRLQNERRQRPPAAKNVHVVEELGRLHAGHAIDSLAEDACLEEVRMKLPTSIRNERVPLAEKCERAVERADACDVLLQRMSPLALIRTSEGPKRKQANEVPRLRSASAGFSRRVFFDARGVAQSCPSSAGREANWRRNWLPPQHFRL